MNKSEAYELLDTALGYVFLGLGIANFGDLIKSLSALGIASMLFMCVLSRAKKNNRR